MTSEDTSTNLCGWCEDKTANLTLFSKSNDKIIGFCNEECWQSYYEIVFNVSLLNLINLNLNFFRKRERSIFNLHNFKN